jgi:predicted nucleic acid-binding Zn ribbon protein
MAEHAQTCMNCGKEIKGRHDKRFCDDSCRNAWHNTQNKESTTYMRMVNTTLKRNRKIMEELNTKGKTVVKKDDLTRRGFNFDFHTNILTTKTGSTYHFCYEHGYLFLEDDAVMLVINQRV